MDVARLAGFEDQSDFRPRAFAHQVVMHRRDAQQARNRRPLLIDPPVAENQKFVALLDRLRRLRAQFVDRRAQARPARPRPGTTSAGSCS